ncbi:NACHT, LRR and PYD domains-containing protein 10, partial [Geodia barretti]
KSTFAWEACRRWDESLRYYHTLVLLKLREKWVLNATSLSDLFRYPDQPSFSKDIAQELHDSHGRNLLLVLDGFDEVSHSFHEDSVIKSILCRQLLPECTIILTTRPVAKSALRSICQPKVDKHVEIIGFTEEERVRYITEV